MIGGAGNSKHRGERGEGRGEREERERAGRLVEAGGGRQRAVIAQILLPAFSRSK